MNKALTKALIHILRPLMRVLLKHNIPYGTFSDIAKWVYVDVADREFALPGKKQTVSRVAIITGLSRKETSRVKNLAIDQELGSADRGHRAIRVINGWRKDPRFTNDHGMAKVLPIEGRTDSFAGLVKKYSGDIPHRAVLDEMVRAGVVERMDGEVRLLSEGYIVTRDEIEKINILGTDTGEFISTVAHNISEGEKNPLFQRKVSYDNIPAEDLPEVRKTLAEISSSFIKSIDEYMSRYDRDTNPTVQGSGRKKAGLGVFYFE
jgi:hypothetical protein